MFGVKETIVFTSFGDGFDAVHEASITVIKISANKRFIVKPPRANLQLVPGLRIIANCALAFPFTVALGGSSLTVAGQLRILTAFPT